MADADPGARRKETAWAYSHDLPSADPSRSAYERSRRASVADGGPRPIRRASNWRAVPPSRGTARATRRVHVADGAGISDRKPGARRSRRSSMHPRSAGRASYAGLFPFPAGAGRVGHRVLPEEHEGSFLADVHDTVTGAQRRPATARGRRASSRPHRVGIRRKRARCARAGDQLQMSTARARRPGVRQRGDTLAGSGNRHCARAPRSTSASVDGPRRPRGTGT